MDVEDARPGFFCNRLVFDAEEGGFDASHNDLLFLDYVAFVQRVMEEVFGVGAAQVSLQQKEQVVSVERVSAHQECAFVESSDQLV